jgi:hypothetical protein
MAAAAAVTGSLLLTVGCSSSNSSSGNTGSDVAVQVDRPSAEAAALAPGASVAVSLPAQPVLVAARRVS